MLISAFILSLVFSSIRPSENILSFMAYNIAFSITVPPYNCLIFLLFFLIFCMPYNFYHYSLLNDSALFHVHNYHILQQIKDIDLSINLRFFQIVKFASYIIWIPISFQFVLQALWMLSITEESAIGTDILISCTSRPLIHFAYLPHRITRFTLDFPLAFFLKIPFLTQSLGSHPLLCSSIKI